MRDDNFLEHFGVKGMKWGVRKKYTPKDRDKEAYKIFKSIKNQEIGKTRFLKRSITVDKQLRKQALSNKDADKYEAFLASQWKHTPVNSAYFKAVRKAGYNAVQDLNDRGIVSDRPMIALDPKGTMRETGRRTLDAWAINEAQRKVKRIGHAMYDDDVNYLEHFGVKGMKWGVRKAKATAGSIRTKHLARKAKRHPQSPEAARAHALRKQVKKKGLDSLSNSELQALNNRLNLEANYRNALKQHPDTLRSNRNKKLLATGAKIVGPIVAKSVGKELAKSSNPNVKLASALLTDDISVSKLINGVKGKKK